MVKTFYYLVMVATGATKVGKIVAQNPSKEPNRPLFFTFLDLQVGHNKIV